MPSRVIVKLTAVAFTLALATGLSTAATSGATTVSTAADTLRYSLKESSAAPGSYLGSLRILPDNQGGIFLMTGSMPEELLRLDNNGRVLSRRNLDGTDGLRRPFFGMTWARDTLLIGVGGAGLGASNIVILDGKLQVRGSFAITRAGTGTQYRGLWPTANGWLVGLETHRLDGKPVSRVTTQLQRFAAQADGQTGPVTITTFRAATPQTYSSVGARLLPQIAPARLFFGALANGTVTVAPDRDYHLQLIDHNGRLIADKRYPVARQPIAANLIDSLKTQIRSQYADTSVYYKEAMEVLNGTAPTSRPVIGGLWVAPDGRMALMRADLVGPTGNRQVDILGPEANFLGRALLPTTHKIEAFLGDVLITSWADTSSATRAKLAENDKSYTPPRHLSRWTLTADR